MRDKRRNLLTTEEQNRTRVDDQELWNAGAERLKSMLADLPVGTGQTLTQLQTRYRKAKESFDAAVADVDAASVCRECEGQCCLNGKYRINVFDALALIAAQNPASADFSQKPACPYCTDAGCTMVSEFRPADCVLFVCDEIEQRLSPQTRLFLSAQEQVIRKCINDASRLTGVQLGIPLLLWAGRSWHRIQTKL